MKRALSVLLALITALSCCTAIGVSAASDSDTDKAAEPTEYLLGDANLDGKVSIVDATEIQRALAQLTALSGLQTALANIYGKGINITCATAIQRHLAELDPDLPIGEPAGDENEGVDPEIPLSTNRMFDRDYIVGLVNDYFG